MNVAVGTGEVRVQPRNYKTPLLQVGEKSGILELRELAKGGQEIDLKQELRQRG